MLKKVSEKKLVKYESHLYILLLNEMWVEWVSGMWDPITIYDKSESELLFANRLNEKIGLLFANRGSK